MTCSRVGDYKSPAAQRVQHWHCLRESSESVMIHQGNARAWFWKSIGLAMLTTLVVFEVV